MSTPSFKVGMLVEHPKRPEWGPGKVIAVAEDRLHVYFRDSLDKKAKVLMRSVAELSVASEQTDAVLDTLPPAVHQDGDWMLPKNYERTMRLATARAAKAEALSNR